MGFRQTSLPGSFVASMDRSPSNFLPFNLFSTSPPDSMKSTALVSIVKNGSLLSNTVVAFQALNDYRRLLSVMNGWDELVVENVHL